MSIVGLQFGLLATPLGKLLAALVAIAAVIFVGRFVLSVAWRLVTVGLVLVGALYALSVLGLF
ncbi:MAG: hypothetical protein ABEJ79_06015 [Halolamina sp.]